MGNILVQRLEFCILVLKKHNYLSSMTKQIQTLLAVLLFLFCNTYAYSQSVANYSLSRSTGITYNSVSVTGNSVPTWRNTSGQYTQDDNRSIFLDIGFDFWYLGTRYTQFSVSTNGFMDFSSSTSNGNSNGAYGYDNTKFSNTTPTGLALAPMYDDLTAQGGSEALGNSIKYLTSGDAPNRVLTVEWINIAVYSNVTPSLNFQVKLYETTGVIEFVYGTMTGGSANYTYTSGINAGTISNPITSAQLLTQQTANTTTFSSTAKNNLTSLPQSNSKLTFTPPNHTGTFNGTVTINSITSSGMTVNYNNWCTNEIGYAIYNSTNNVDFTFVTQNAANTTSYAATGLLPNTTYYWRVYAVNDGKLSNVAANNATTSAAGNKVSTGSGNWSTNGTWSPSGAPGPTDNVTIRNGHTVTINTNASCNNLTVGEGSSGTLRIGNNSTSRSLSVNGNVVINNGGTLIAGNTNATHTASVSGNVTNNGTLDFRPTGSRLVNVTFDKDGSQTISGSGGTTRFNTVTMNMGSTADNILEISTSNLSLENTFLTLTNGTLKLSSTYSLNVDLFSGNTTLPISTGIYLNNPNVTLNFQGNLVLAGRLNIDAGVINIGDAADEYLESNGGVIDIKGGGLNVASRYFSTNINTLSNFSISGGTFTIPTVGSSSTSVYPFQINAFGSSFNMTGGSIVIQREGGNGSQDLGLYIDGLATNGISGGTIQFGNNSTPSSQTLNVYSTSEFPEMLIHNANTTVKLLNPLTIDNGLTITGGALNANSNNINIYGNWTSTGTYTTGSNTTSFIGTGIQTINTTGGENFDNVTVDKPSGNLVLASNAAVNLLTLTSGNLSINGNTLALADLNASVGKIIGSNTSSLTINGSGDFGFLNLLNTSIANKTLYNLTINRSSSGVVTIGTDSLRVKNTINIQNGTLQTNNRLILVSDAAGTARIGPLTTGNITGNVIAQRFIPGGVNKRQWRYLSSPVNVGGSMSVNQFKDNIFITGPGGVTNSFDNSPNNTISFRTYLESKPGIVDSGWVAAPNGNATYPTGTGLSVFVRGSRSLPNPFLNWTVPDNVTIDLIGEVNKGNFNFNLSYTANGVSQADGFNFIGNPYPSPIDFLAASGITKNNIQNRFWVYNPIKRVYGIFDGALDQGTNDITRYISSGQGFFVKATSASSPSLQLTENVKVENTPINFFRNQLSENILKLVLEKDSTTSDELIIAFREGAQKEDGDESDVVKLFNENLNFYSKSNNGINLAINQYPIPLTADTINLSSFAYNEGSPWTGNYSIQFKNVESVDANINLYLADVYLNKYINIRNHTGYEFEINADANSMGNDRFKLMFGDINLSTDKISSNDLILYPNPVRNALNIVLSSNTKDAPCKIEVIDPMGRKVLSTETEIQGAKVNLDIRELPVGMYLINMYSDSGVWQSKFIKQ